MVTDLLCDDGLLLDQHCLSFGIVIHPLDLFLDDFWIEVWELDFGILLQLLQAVLKNLSSEALDKVNEFVIPTLFVELDPRSKLIVPVLPAPVVFLDIEHLAVGWRQSVQMKRQFFEIHLTICNM